jgi:tetratricopeptide (TPR) repeat protein
VNREPSRSRSRGGPPGAAGALLLLLAGAAAAPPGPALAGDRAAALARAAAGDSLRALGELPRAETAYRDALAEEDRLCEARYGLARVALERKETGAAERHLAPMEGDSRCATLHALGMGLVRLEEKRLKDAELFLIKAAVGKESQPEAVRLEIAGALAELYEAKDVPRLAVDHLDEVIALSPSDPAPVVRKGKLLVSMREYDAALATFRVALGRDSTCAEAMEEIATLYTRAKRPADAAEWRARLAAARPSAAAHLAAGDAWFAAKRYGPAGEAYRRAVEMDSTLAAARLGLARSALEAGDREAALAAYKELRDTAGLTARDYEGMGRALLDKKDYPGAREAYLRAAALDPTLADAHFYAGYTHLAERNYAEAIPFFEKRIAADTTSAAAYANLGLCYLQVGERAKGIEMLERATRLRPDDAQSRSWLAQAHAMQSSWGKATQEYRASLELDPNNAESWRWLGYCLLNQERPEEAVQALLKADALEPRNVQGLVWLAQGYGLAGQLDKSEATFRKALEIDPGQSDAKAGLEELSKVNRKKTKSGSGGGGS